MSLYILILVLLVLACFFIVWPYLTHQQKRENQSTVSLAVFKERLLDLETEKQAGTISDDIFIKLKDELTSTLAEEVDGNSLINTQASTDNKIPLWIGGSAAAMLICVSVMLYAALGSASLLESKALMDDFKIKQMQFTHGKTVDLLASTQALEAVLIKEPKQAESWYIIARTYMDLDEFALAEKAFLTVVDLARPKATTIELAGLLGQYAQASYFNHQQTLNDSANNALKEAIALNPEETTSLSLIGINAFKQADYPVAIENWQKVLKIIGPNSPNANAIIASIQNAKAQMGDTTHKTLAAQAGMPTKHVTVTVALAPEFQDKLPANTTVFVFARPTDGSRMPLAARKLTLGQLPITLTLDDSNAMGPMGKISQASSVHVGAVVAQSGTPGAKPGDLTGDLQNVPVGLDQKPLSLMINTQVK